MIFKDRFDAAKLLLPLLESYKDTQSVIMAIPRGGVPIACYIGKKLNLPVELLFTKKLGHPLNKEVAIGAVSLEGRTIEYDLDIDYRYIEAETERIRRDLADRYKRFMGNHKPIDIKGKTVIIVDDGIATGATMLASIEMMRYRAPAKIVVATPVASQEAIAKLIKVTDDLICLEIPRNFRAVGLYYQDFSEVQDNEVSALMSDRLLTS